MYINKQTIGDDSVEKTEVRRDYQIIAGEETYDNKKVVVYGIIMTEWMNGKSETIQLSSISTDLKAVSSLAEKMRAGEVQLVHFKDIVIDYISEI